MLRDFILHPFAPSEVEVQLLHGLAFDWAQAERKFGRFSVMTEGRA